MKRLLSAAFCAGLLLAQPAPASPRSLSLPLPCAGLSAPVIPPVQPQGLNAAADRILRSSLLLTVGGIKPISITPMSIPREALEQTVRRISDPDLSFFWTRIHPDKDYHEFTAVNRRALARLSRDRSVVRILEKHGIEVPRDADGWLELYAKAVEADGYAQTGPFWANLAIGVLLGFPPTEAEMYAQTRLEDKVPSRRGVLTRRRDGFSPTGYARFTDQELERDRYFIESAQTLMESYEALLAAGSTPLEALDDASRLAEGLPPFPEELLMPEEAGRPSAPGSPAPPAPRRPS